MCAQVWGFDLWTLPGSNGSEDWSFSRWGSPFLSYLWLSKPKHCSWMNWQNLVPDPLLSSGQSLTQGVLDAQRPLSCIFRISSDNVKGETLRPEVIPSQLECSFPLSSLLSSLSSLSPPYFLNKSILKIKGEVLFPVPTSYVNPLSAHWLLRLHVCWCFSMALSLFSGTFHVKPLTALTFHPQSLTWFGLRGLFHSSVFLWKARWLGWLQ